MRTANQGISILAGLILSMSVGGEENGDIARILSTDAVVEAGQIVKGESQIGEALDRVWIARFGAWLTAHATVQRRLELKTSLGILGLAPTPNNLYQSRRPQWVPTIGEARATYSFFEDTPRLQATVGYFPYKYNPESRNLGEYLYRTMAYPPTIMNTDWIIVNRAQANLLGFRLSSTLSGAGHGLAGPLSQDLLFTSETQNPPLWDFSLGYLFAVRLLTSIDIGAGVNFWRIVPVDREVTTPKISSNMYVDTLAGDTSYYSFKSLKLMARMAFDFKRLVPVRAMGREDCRIYGEAAVLDWMGQDTLYRKTSLLERTPVMIGFNIPAFKILDVLAMELEWFGSPYQNNLQRSVQELQPQPNEGGGTADDIKWSVYASKQVLNGLFLRLQFARDHLRSVDFNNDKMLSYRENTATTSHWYWILQINYGI